MNDTTLLLGLAGVRVERVVCDADGTRVVTVSTHDETAAACPACGVFDFAEGADGDVSEGSAVWGGPAAAAVVQEPVAVRGTVVWQGFVHRVDRRDRPRMRTTGRLRRSIAAAVGDAARSVDEVATAHQVS